MLVTTDRHLHDRHTLHLFISGRDKKTSSSMSRSSSGFESSHLPSPEYPTHPQTLTSTSSSKTCLPSILPSLRPPKNSLSLLSPAKGHGPSGAIARSQSCMELRSNPASGLVRRSFSLTLLHKKQKRQCVDPKNRNLTPSVKTKESTQDTVNPPKDCQVVSPSSQASITSHNVECSTCIRDTVNVFPPEQAETKQSTHLQLPPTVPIERSNHPLLTASFPTPRREPLLTQTACLYHTNHMLSADTSSPSLSANFEAHQLKMKRNKKTNSVNIGSLVEEKL